MPAFPASVVRAVENDRFPVSTTKGRGVLDDAPRRADRGGDAGREVLRAGRRLQPPAQVPPAAS